MNGNDFMSWVLRSPFHGLLSNGTMLITVTGCKTGKKYTTPVGYYRDGNCLWILTSRDRTWWKNLRGGAEVELLLKRESVRGFAEVEQDNSAVQARLCDYVRHIPQAAKPMGIRTEQGKPNTEDIARLAKERLFVKVMLGEN